MKFKKDSLAPVIMTFGIIFSFCSIGCDRRMVLGAVKIIRYLSRDSTDKCDWKSELKRPLGSPARCAVDKCYQKDGKALMDCLNKKCGRFCGTGAIYSGSTDTSGSIQLRHLKKSKEKKCDWPSEMDGYKCMRSVVSECKQGKSYSFTYEAARDCLYKIFNKRCRHLCKPNSGSTDTSSKEKKCHWLPVWKRKKARYKCLRSVISECKQSKGKSYSYTREAANDCFAKRIDKRCGHLCK